MATRRPYGFTKSGINQVVIPLLLTPFIIAALFFQWLTFHALLSEKAIARYKPAGFLSSGHVIVSGTVSRATPVTSPLGKSGVGWVGTIGYLKTQKHGTSFVSICTRSDLSELTLNDHRPYGMEDSHDWSLTFVQPSQPVVVGNGNTLDDPLPVVDFGDPLITNAPIPASMKQWCAAELSQSTHTVFYREATLLTGTPISVAGCSTDGTHVVRCDDGGPYLFTNHKFADVYDAWHNGVEFIAIFGGSWNLFILSLAGFLAAKRLAHTKPTLREKQGAT